MNEEFLFVEKYRPKTIQETVLTNELKSLFQQFVFQKNIPNLILSGPAGVGKTTVAKAMLNELDCDYIVINGSMKGNIDTLRNEIFNFASTVSLSGGRKYVILDEADYLNANSTQPALRNFMEEFSKNCGFILTCNYANRIIEPLHSRCSVIEFKITKKDITKLASQFFKRTCHILDVENIEYDKAVVAEVINKHFPDCRRILNELQRYSTTGGIDSGILINLQDIAIKDLISLIKDKNFTEVRKWVSDHIDSNVNSLFRKLYDTSSENMKAQFIPPFIELINKYQYQAAFVADQEINLMSFFSEVMVNGFYQ